MPDRPSHTLRDYDWEQCYATSDLRADGQPVDILQDFYIPALSRATRYDRVAGYFTSTSLAAASQGFSRFVTVKQQIAEFERFQADVTNRPTPAVHFHCEVPDRNAMLALKNKLL